MGFVGIILFCVFIIAIISFIYTVIAKKVDEKEKNGNANISDAFLLLLVGMTSVPFILVLVGSIFTLILEGV